MGDERDRILKLLEDGKITAEQAARLIEALGARPSDVVGPPVPPFPAMRHWRRHTFQGMDRMPDIVAKAVSSAIRSGCGPGEDATDEFVGRRGLLVKSVSGDVEVSGWDEEKVSLTHRGTVKARAVGQGVNVRSVSGEIVARMHREGELEVVTVSGDVKVQGVEGRTHVRTVSGDIEAAGPRSEVGVATVSGSVELVDVAGRLEVETRSGDVELTPSGPVSGSICTRSGDVTLMLSADADVLLEVECEQGGAVDVDSDLRFEAIERSESRARLRFGAGAGTLRVWTRDADVAVREAATEEKK